MFRLHLHRLRTPLCGLLAGFAPGGLWRGADAAAPDRLHPARARVPANETLEISVAYEDQDARLEDFQWRVEAGEIEGNGTPTVTYRAPEQPGDYAIAVTAAYGEDGTALTLDGVVQVTQAIATGPAAVVAASETEPEPAAGSERAEAPEQAARAGQEGVPAAGSATTGASEPAPAAAAEPAEASTPDEAIDRARQTLEEVTAAAPEKRRRPRRRRGRRRARAPSRTKRPKRLSRTRRRPGASPHSRKRALRPRPAPASTGSWRDGA